MDGGAWWAAVHGVTRSRTRLSDFTFTFHFHALEKEIVFKSLIALMLTLNTRILFCQLDSSLLRRATLVTKLHNKTSIGLKIKP